jgi:hypothetical protein
MSCPLILTFTIQQYSQSIQFLFFFRIPFLLFAGFVWFAIIQWTTPGTLLRKANLWCIIGIPGIWWVDLQVDGVRRG